MSCDKNTCEYKCVDEVLHIIYKKEIPKYINDIANKYEGDISDRIGINFPMSFFEGICKDCKDIKKNIVFKSCEIMKYKDSTKYVVVYKKGDKITKDHELLHAKYYIDENYKKKIQLIWENMNKENKKKVVNMLKKMGYPEKEEIMIDEFQAYYYTEKPNFFGKKI